MSIKVLFVCLANIGRRQVAQACFDQLSKYDSDSAGIGVDEQLARRTLSSMKLKDLSNQRSVECKRKLVDLPTAIHLEQSAIGTKEE